MTELFFLARQIEVWIAIATYWLNDIEGFRRDPEHDDHRWPTPTERDLCASTNALSALIATRFPQLDRRHLFAVFDPIQQWRATHSADGLPTTAELYAGMDRAAIELSALRMLLGPEDWAEPRPTQPDNADKVEAAVRTRKSRDEYNVEVRAYLTEYPDAGAREVAKAIGCAPNTVYKLPAYLAVAHERKKGRKPKTVSLEKPMADIATKVDGGLAELVREQQRDDRTRKIHPRERL